MPLLPRRRFLASAAAAALAPKLWALPVAEGATFRLIAAQDRARTLRNAARWLPERPETITEFLSPKSPGGPHDYFSEADYFWPNPANPAGPYKEIDGKSNPGNFLAHRLALIRLGQAMPALTAGFVLTRKAAYAKAAAAHLRAWFVAPSTRMTPNLQFAQGFHGGPTGRSYGIIDTLHLVEVARAAPFLHDFLSAAEFTAVRAWFGEYLGWMQASDPGKKERDATNNHGIAWALQAAEFARLSGNDAARSEVRERFRNVQLPMQMAADGGFPRELARTKPYGYSIFTFDCAAMLCQSLQTPLRADSAGVAGPPQPSEIGFSLADGRGVCLAAKFLYPYLRDKSSWPYKHDVEHWESWPVRSPGLLFCGLDCAKPEYIDLWRKLDPDPTDPEVIRNFPVRQPILWI